MNHKITRLFPGLIFLLVYSNVFAQVDIQDKSEIVGLWKVVATTPSLTKKKKITHEKWEFFADGTYKLSAPDHRAKGEVQTKSTYLIENGKIKVAVPGRPGKFSTYSIYEKNPSGLVLKGGLEGFYFLEK